MKHDFSCFCGGGGGGVFSDIQFDEQTFVIVESLSQLKIVAV